MSPDALHAAAIVDLAWAGARRNVLDRSISFLRTATALEPNNAAVLADLSAAYLVRSEHDDSVRDLFAAIDAAQAALEADPSNLPAQFNLALALGRGQLVTESIGAWNRYLTIDSSSEWSREARTRLRELAPRPRPLRPGVAAPDTAIEEFARNDTQAAREVGMDEWLGEWGTAVLQGDSAEADRVLRGTSALVRGVEGARGDGTLRDELALIRRTNDVERRARLARAHVAYSEAQRAYRLARYTDASHFYDDARHLADPSTPLELWSTFGRAATATYAADSVARDSLLGRISRTVGVDRLPALRGRVSWAIGTSRLRSGRFEEARDAYARARDAFAAIGESTNFGATASMVAESELSLGDVANGYASMLRALRALRPGGPTVWMHNALFLLTRFTAGDGMPFAALRLGNEDIRISSALTPGYYVAEARSMRAQLLSREAPNDALRELALVDSALANEPIGIPRSWVEEQARLTRAVMNTDHDPLVAIAALDSVIRFFDNRNATRVMRALIARAEGFIVAHDSSRAIADLRRAVGILGREKEAISRDGNRVALVAAARAVFDRLVMVSVRSGNSRAALEFLEQSRISLAESGRDRVPLNPLRPNPATTVVDYALIGDTLLTWIVRGSALSLDVRTVPRSALTTSLVRVRAAMEMRSPFEPMRRDLAMLYDLLVRPVAANVGGPNGTVVVVADGLLAAVPFAALFDEQRRLFLVESNDLRIAGSLDDVRRPVAPSVRRATNDSVLLVFNPAIDRAANRTLQALDSAASEIPRLVAEYPQARVLAGPGATAAAFMAAVRHARQVHYAGHAIADDQRPEQSYLVLAPNDQNPSGRLTADSVARTDLRSVDLVVLAACETIAARGLQGGEGSGYRGLARAFLEAGAGGVIGSLWRVDDRYTARLMVAFHQGFKTSGNAGNSLRNAQLQLLRGDDLELRSPAAWAGFQYIGR